jgi:hypothetical protein
MLPCIGRERSRTLSHRVDAEAGRRWNRVRTSPVHRLFNFAHSSKVNELARLPVAHFLICEIKYPTAPAALLIGPKGSGTCVRVGSWATHRRFQCKKMEPKSLRRRWRQEGVF